MACSLLESTEPGLYCFIGGFIKSEAAIAEIVEEIARACFGY